MASIEYWKEPHLLRINFREGEVDFSREVSPGVTFHYARAEGEDVLVYVEFYEWPGRDLDGVSFKQIDSSGKTEIEIPEWLLENGPRDGPGELAKLINRRED